MTTRARRGKPDESALPLLEHQIRLINRFPDQNPHPVMRMSDEGVLLYANAASAPIVDVLGATVGQPLDDRWADTLRHCSEDPEVSLEIESGGRTYAILAVPVPEFEFINLYGTDITAEKVVARFPDQNPPPVFRINDEGRLLYANRASGPIIGALGVVVGDRLPADVVDRLLTRLDGTSSAPVEVHGDNRIFSLWPVAIPEFAFINVYGTDVTAARAVNKFPDQNPNPVLRVDPDTGNLEYANPVAAPIVRAWGIEIGERLPADVLRLVEDAARDGEAGMLEVEADGRLYAILVVSIYEFGFINLYGTDITAARQVEAANRENERLLLNILPEPIADRLRHGERVIADRFDDVTLLFADIVDFTRFSSRLPATDVVAVLNDVFSLFDALVDRYGLEKIKTIGDAYMVVGGLPERTADHADRVAEMALELSRAMDQLRDNRGHHFIFRIGIHSGPAVAGVIGVKKFIYDVWGDTVNTASRMESHGVPGRIQVTQPVYERLRERYRFEPRGVIEVRGKGPMPTWFLLGKQPAIGDSAAEYVPRG